MSEFIYIVSGHTGIYSDRKEWMVCWCVTNEDAVAYSHAAAEEVEKIVSAPGWDDLDWDQQEAAFKTKLDPFRPKLYGDTVIYSVTKVQRGDLRKLLIALDAILGVATNDGGEAGELELRARMEQIAHITRKAMDEAEPPQPRSGTAPKGTS